MIANTMLYALSVIRRREVVPAVLRGVKCKSVGHFRQGMARDSTLGGYPGTRGRMAA